MKIKPGVQMQGVRPELLLGLMVAERAYAMRGIEMTITSLLDGRHSATSLHYTGCAADIRTRDIPDHYNAVDVVKDIKEGLTSDYDVILESDHIHLEYQPRAK